MAHCVVRYNVCSLVHCLHIAIRYTTTLSSTVTEWTLPPLPPSLLTSTPAVSPVSSLLSSQTRTKPKLLQASGTRGANVQMYVYGDCMRRYRSRHKWIAFFDNDEFLMLKV